MDAERPRPEEDGQANEVSPPEAEAIERMGPLLLRRYRKADGRALLLYTRVRGASEE